MENLLLRLLPRERHPVFVRYAASAGIVGIAALLRYTMSGQLQNYPILLFFPAVFLCALLFDKGSGFFATFLSALVSGLVFISPQRALEISSGDVVALLIFIVVGCTMSAVTEALRHAVDELGRAEAGKSLLLEELAHRTKNDLAIISSAITLQARASTNEDVREALEAANSRVQVVAAAQTRLRTRESGAEVELAGYLQELCTGLGDLLRGVRPIAVRLDCPAVSVDDSAAVTIGLIVNELVTNSLKYAFPSDRGGIVDVKVHQRPEGGLVVSVSDSGPGCPEDAAGLGTRLVRLLAKQRGGHFQRSGQDSGCKAVAVLPDID